MELLNTSAVEKATRNPAGRPSALAFVTDADSETVLHGAFRQDAGGAVLRGNITKAVQHLASARSPRILVVDISDVALPVSEVHNLADVCEPGVSVIVIGTRNEVGLYRDLLQAGVAEYLVKPLTPHLVADALKTATQGAEPTPISRKLGKLIAFTGGRGGVGTSTMAVNLAWHFGERQARRVALLDLDLHNGACSLMLNLVPSSGLRDALENPLRVDSLFLERTMALYGDRLHVLGSEEPLQNELRFASGGIETLVGVLREQFHYIVADVPRLPGAISRRMLELADIRVIVVDQTLQAVRDAARLRRLPAADGAERRDLIVVNRKGEAGRHAVGIAEITGALDHRVSSVMPFQPALFSAAAARGVVPAARRGRFADAIAALATEISGQQARRSSRWRLFR
jgi:pilus assembly protein CpaE